MFLTVSHLVHVCLYVCVLHASLSEDDVPDMDPLDEMMASYSQELPSSLVPGPSASSSYTYRLPASLVPSTVSGSDEPAAKRAFRSPPISPKKGAALTSPDKASPKKSPAKGKTSEAQSQVCVMIRGIDTTRC